MIFTLPTPWLVEFLFNPPISTHKILFTHPFSLQGPPAINNDRSLTLQEILSSYILECHIIYLLFTKAFFKSRLSCAAIEVYHNVRHHTLTSTGKFYFSILLAEREIYFLGLVKI
jgi:hypothetical protein